MPALLEPASSLDDLEMLCAADYPATEVQWLWPNRIPIGKVTLLVGDPGTGKSLVALDIAARVSRGASWPDQNPPPRHPGEGDSEPGYPFPGSVLILSSDDDIRDTIRPRLDAAGADPHRVFVLPSISDLRHDLQKLRTALDRLPDCRLIVIDPVNSYVGPGDSHFHSVVRRVFEPLAKLAAEKGIAVVGVSHLRKHDGAAIQRAAGSMGFVASARAVWTVCRDPVQAHRYLMLQVKNNFTADTSGLAYTICSASSGDESSSPAIQWQEESVTTSAVEALQPEKKSRGPEPAELTLAMDWLKKELVHGPKLALFVYAEGVFTGGFEERTLRRALVAIGGRTRKLGFLGDWEWYLPDYDFPSRAEMSIDRNAPAPEPLSRSRTNSPESAISDPSENLTTSAETCPLRENTHISEQETSPLREDTTDHEPVPDPQGEDSESSTDGADRFVPYEHHLAQCKLDRILKSRCRLGGRRNKLRSVEFNLIKPFSFKHPSRCRAP